MSRAERSLPLPWAPRPFEGEALGSWLGRLAAAYGMNVDPFAASTGLSIDFGRIDNWLALPALLPSDVERLSALCRLPTADLPAPYEGEAPAQLIYCHRCLCLNPLDITAPYWQARWLLGMDSAWCSTHDQRYERTTLSSVRNRRNMPRLLRAISCRRARQRSPRPWPRWLLAEFVNG